VVKDLEGAKVILLNWLLRAPIERLRQRTGKFWTVLNSNPVVPTFIMKDYQLTPSFLTSMHHVIYLSAHPLFYLYIFPSIRPSSVQSFTFLSIYLHINPLFSHSYIHIPTHQFNSVVCNSQHSSLMSRWPITHICYWIG